VEIGGAADGGQGADAVVRQHWMWLPQLGSE
jgi:hypothetical protein